MSFFIHRPIFAVVISVLIVLAGAIAYETLPVAQYPAVIPPQVLVTASFPGASARTVAATVASPIEVQVNGVENMLYMESRSTNDGNLRLYVTFKLGTNVDIAQVNVQNRVALATPGLPKEVRDLGVSTKKVSSSITLVVNLT